MPNVPAPSAGWNFYGVAIEIVRQRLVGPLFRTTRRA